LHRPFVPAELRDRIGESVTVSGWVHDVRLLGGISFVLLRNSNGIIQIAAPKKQVDAEIFSLIQGLHQEDVISCRGMVKASDAARKGFEVVPTELRVLSSASTPLPLDPRGVTSAALDTRLAWRTLDLRRPESAAVFKVQDAIVSAFEAYLHENCFIRAFTPSIIGGISEGGAEVFKIDYYGKPAFLRQDPQLHRQLTIAGGFERIYDLGTNWRAELSHTPRHLSEHRTIAPEMAFLRDERDTMRLEEGMVVSAVEAVAKCTDQLELLNVSVRPPALPFPEIDFPEVYSILEGMGKKIPWGEDIDSEGLKLLAAHVKEKFGSDFFFLNRFPSNLKPFYVMKVDEDPEYARSVDLVFRGTEVSSGGQREHRYERIIAQIREKGMREDDLSWFTQPFRYGVPPHGGFSFGIERFTALLLNLDSVKEAALFPRDPERLQP
jgi:nondiscriminating aspartyl-tRNA synthetase